MVDTLDQWVDKSETYSFTCLVCGDSVVVIAIGQDEANQMLEKDGWYHNRFGNWYCPHHKEET